MKPKEVEIEDCADRINSICTYIDLLPGNHNILTDMEKKSLLFNSFPKTWRLEFTLNGNDSELASKKEIKDFMEEKKEIADREESSKERAKAKVKRMKDARKKRDNIRGNQPCWTLNGAHLWKDCPANPKNPGRGQGTFNHFGRNPNPINSYNRNFNRRGFQGREFQGRGFPGRNDHSQGFGQGRGPQQEQYYQNFQKDQSDASTLSTVTSHTNSHDWDSYTNDIYNQQHNQQYQGGYNYHY